MNVTDYPNKLIRNIQILSIDVALGSLSVGYMALKILKVTANPIWWIILPLAVWIVYTIDHLIDGFKNPDSVIIRHKFHYNHWKPLAIIISVSIIITLILSFQYLDKKVLYNGIILSIIVTVYFIILYFLKRKKPILLQKELIIAVVYTIGIFMAPLTWHSGELSFSQSIVIVSIFLLAWFEGILISYFDFDYDSMEGNTSFSILFGRPFSRKFLIVCHMIMEVILIIALIITPINAVFWSLLIVLVMNALLGIVALFPHLFLKNNYYRIIGESVFILPVLIVLA